jgi:hypothetical protein
VVWGMCLPRDFGEFWPDGVCEAVAGGADSDDGWSDRLKAFYLAQTPEERKVLFDFASDGVAGAAHAYPSYAIMKFLREIGTRQGHDRPPLTPIMAHEPPQFFDIVRGTKKLGSFLVTAAYTVDAALKAIIERMEPGVHQFFPIELRYRGKPYSGPYYTLVIGRYLDCFLPEMSSNESWRHNGPRTYFHEENKKGLQGLALSKAAFQGSHLWIERRMSLDLICLSDEMQTEIAKEGLRIPRHYRMREV